VTAESRWVVDRSFEAEAVAESATYTTTVDVDRVLGPGLDPSIAAVYHVNATYPDAMGADRVKLLVAARQRIEVDQ
jgi:hypothetical protein